MKTDEQIEKGIECCSEFLCGECPYKNIQGMPDFINIRCMLVLMNDIKDYVKRLKDSPVETLPLDYTPVCPKGYTDCIWDPAYIQFNHPKWYKELYGDMPPAKAVLTDEGCYEMIKQHPEICFYYDNEDK